MRELRKDGRFNGHRPIEERLWGRTVKNERGCWLFQGAKHEFGHGMISYKNVFTTAHRVAWMLTKGPCPVKPHVIDHACGEPSCINPDHLRKVLQSQNCMELAHKKGSPFLRNKNKTHCDYGHPFSGDNLKWIIAHGRPTRVCIACRQRMSREATQRTKAKRAAKRAAL